MMEAGWSGWGVDWDGRVGVAPPRCQASRRRAESSLRTPGGAAGQTGRLLPITRQDPHKEIGSIQQGRASTRCT